MSACILHLLQWTTLILSISKIFTQNPTCRPCVRPNEIYVRERTCETTCNNLQQICVSVRKATSKACHCKDGYAKDITSTCMPIRDCDNRTSGNCGLNEEYRCDNFCAFECRKVINPCPHYYNCSKGCYCLSGYFRNSTGSCVPAIECNRCQPIFSK